MGWSLVVLGRAQLGKTFFEEIRGGLGRCQLETKSSSNWIEIAPKSVPGGVLGRSWGVLWGPGGVLGEVPGIILGRLKDLGGLGRSWGRLGAVLGPSWGRLGAILGPSWVVLGLSWGVLGGPGAVLEALGGGLGSIFGDLQKYTKT